MRSASFLVVVVLSAAAIAGCSDQPQPPAPMPGVQPGQTAYPVPGFSMTGVPVTGLPMTGLPMTGLPVTGLPMTGAPALGPSPCIVGLWQANDFLAMVRRNIRSQLEGDARLTAAGGTIRFEFAPLDPTGQGELVAIADDLVHRAETRVQGFRVTATHTMRGRAKMPYRLPLPGALVVDEPTESDLAGHILVRATGGFRLGGGGRPRVDLSDEYLYECSPTELRVWEAGTDGRRGNPVVFDRVTTP